MNRRQSRTQAFELIFESNFEKNAPKEILDLKKSLGTEISEFAKNSLIGVSEHRDKIESYIVKNLKNWKRERLPKVVYAILQLAIFEMLFDKTLSEKIVINEAVELAKTFASPEDAAFVNGVLGAVYKESQNEE